MRIMRFLFKLLFRSSSFFLSKKNYMTLGKEARLAIYCMLFVEAEYKFEKRNYTGGLCRLVHNLCNNVYQDEIGLVNIYRSLPEMHRKLAAVNPQYYNYNVGLIFPEDIRGWSTRLNIIIECINETENEIYNSSTYATLD